jgi:ribosomal protein S18 acetylase RimI-like enzyme
MSGTLQPAPTLRPATPADARALAALAECTFRDTFAAHNSPQNMDAHCRAHYGEALQAAEIARADHVTLVVDAHGALLAYAQLRWGAAPACVSSRQAGEIRRFYVDASWHGKGIAQALMQGCLEALQARGSRAVWLGVWEHNPRASAFYRKWGFMEVGEHCFAVGDDPQRDVILERALC